MIRLETLIELKFLKSSWSCLARIFRILNALAIKAPAQSSEPPGPGSLPPEYNIRKTDCNSSRGGAFGFLSGSVLRRKTVGT